jgi:hypothetical protein
MGEGTLPRAHCVLDPSVALQAQVNAVASIPVMA